MNASHPPERAAAPLIRLGGTGPQARQPRRIVQRVKSQLERPDAWSRASRNSAIRGFTANLARYLTEGVPDIDGERPLLVRCVDEGLAAWSAAHRRAHPERSPLLGYVRGALYLLPQALEWRVSWERADGEVQEWEPLEQPIVGRWKGEAPLMAHRRERSTDTAYIVISPANYRLLALVRFLWCPPLGMRSLGADLDDLVCRYG